MTATSCPDWRFDTKRNRHRFPDDLMFQLTPEEKGLMQHWDGPAVSAKFVNRARES